MDPRDHELLKRVAAGERMFKPAEGEATDAPSWLEVVERLRRLRDQRYIRMPEPRSYYGQRGYQQAGPCELTADGRDAVERFGQ